MPGATHRAKTANDTRVVMVSHPGQEIVYVMMSDLLKMSAQILLTFERQTEVRIY